MTIVITVIIIIITFAYIVYPFFRKSVVTPAMVSKAPAGKGTVKQVKKPARKPRDIDTEIERRVSDIRGKAKAVCPECGANYREGSRFCSQCGADLLVKHNDED